VLLEQGHFTLAVLSGAMSGPDDDPQPALAPIEIQRLKNIDRNNKLLKALGIQAFQAPNDAVSGNRSPAKV